MGAGSILEGMCEIECEKQNVIVCFFSAKTRTKKYRVLEEKNREKGPEINWRG